MSEQRVEYRRLGKSGLRVSVPIFGTLGIGNNKWGSGNWILDEDKALPLLKAAWDRGINTFDTANMYSNGASERIIGKFIKQYNIPREKILIFTKCFVTVPDDETTNPLEHPPLKDQRDYVNQGGLSRAAIFNAVAASLARLDTPYIDLLQIHRNDPETPPEETMRALHDLVVAGKVRYIGGSSMRAWQFAELQHVAERNGWTPFVSMQNEYSLLYREDERDLIPFCNAHGIGIIPWGPLAGGNLVRPLGQKTARGTAGNLVSNPTEEDNAIIARTAELAEKKDWTKAEVALAWIISKVSSPVVGVTSVERLDQAIATGKRLSESEIKYLEEPYKPKPLRWHA